jgi:ribosomal protein L32E
MTETEKEKEAKITKLTNTLFLGKIVEQIGFDKTIELLKEAKEDAIKILKLSKL